MILKNPMGYPELVDAFECSFVNNSCCFLANPHNVQYFFRSTYYNQETVFFPVEYQKNRTE